jgi:thioredoxin-like negative regulator of GroEL
VTGDAESDADKWIEKHGAKYAYAYDKPGKLKRYFGITGIPHAVLIDASGTVVWSGHPGELPIDALQKSLAGALPKPLWEWTPASKPVQAALLKRSYAKALEEAAKLSEADGGPEIKTSIQGIVQARVEGLRRSYEAGDFLGADTAASLLVKELDGLPEKETASKILADIKANKDAQPVIKTQKQIAKLRAAGLSKRKEIEKAIEDLLEIQSEHPGTFAAKEADALIAELRKKLGG